MDKNVGRVVSKVLANGGGSLAKGKMTGNLFWDVIVSYSKHENICAVWRNYFEPAFEDTQGKIWGLTTSVLDGFNYYLTEPIPGYQIITLDECSKKPKYSFVKLVPVTKIDRSDKRFKIEDNYLLFKDIDSFNSWFKDNATGIFQAEGDH